MGQAVRRKIVRLDLNRSKTKDENAFKLPARTHGAGKARPIQSDFIGLKPNTKYKVGLRNQPGNKFEDITDFCYPGRASRKYNTHKTSKHGRWIYFKTDASGQLSLFIRTRGTQSVGLPAAGSKAPWANHWKYQRKTFPDSDRNNIVIIEYSKVLNADTTDKIKEVVTGIDFTNPNSTPPKSVLEYVLPKPTHDRKYTSLRKNPDFIQSFYVDNKSVGNSKTVDITDVTLYLRKKAPRNGNNGVKDPGILVTLLDMVSGNPVTSRFYTDSYSYKNWSQLSASGDASLGITFPFKSPVTVRTGRSYAIAVDLLDEDFELWKSIRGERLVGTEDRPSPGSSPEHTGDLYERGSFTSGTGSVNPREFLFKKNPRADLKFDVHISEYSLANVEFYLVNDSYEFLSLNANSAGLDDNWIGGEYVYKVANAKLGNIAVTAGDNVITGSGTTFDSDVTEDSYIIIRGANTLIEELVKVDQVISNTELRLEDDATLSIANGTYLVTPIAQVEDYFTNGKDLICKGSTANSTNYFQAGDEIRGIQSDTTATIANVENLPMSLYRSDFRMNLPPMYKLNTNYAFSQESGSTYYIASNSSAPVPKTPVFDLLAPNHIRDYQSLILSRSNEVQHASNLYDGSGDLSNPYRGKSSAIYIQYQYTGANTKAYECPKLNVRECNIITHGWDINNDATNEHTNNGNAFTKHISKQLTFDRDKSAEDIRVIYNAYKPAGTDIKVYAKIYNDKDPDAFDDKYWTELELVSGEGQVSSKTNTNDYREFEYGFPAYPESNVTLSGSVTTQEDNVVITGEGTTWSSSLANNDVIKIYSSLFPENYGVFCIESVDSDTQITLTEAVANVNIVGEGFKIDTLKTPYTAFNDADNFNIVKYFNEDGEAFDTYQTVVVKTVLLAESPNFVPKVDDYRVIGVSA